MYVFVHVHAQAHTCTCVANRKIFLLCQVLITFNPISHHRIQVKLKWEKIEYIIFICANFSIFHARKSNDNKTDWTGHLLLSHNFYASFEAYSGELFWDNDALMAAKNHGPLDFQFSSQECWHLSSRAKPHSYQRRCEHVNSHLYGSSIYICLVLCRKICWTYKNLFRPLFGEVISSFRTFEEG